MSVSVLKRRKSVAIMVMPLRADKEAMTTVKIRGVRRSGSTIRMILLRMVIFYA
jgi:hypothetical protein